MDRLGDDLTEEVLQYLTLEDKIRLECVPKQWRRLLFNKRFDIELKVISENSNEINSRKVFYLNEQVLELVVKKCPNIRKVSRFQRGKVLSMIVQYCHHLKALKLTDISSDDNTLSFFRKYLGKYRDRIHAKGL